MNVGKEPAIVCIMRIKNEEEWIGMSLEETCRLAREIIVLDDGSTDRTPEICRRFPQVTYVRRDRGTDEVRDKRELLQMALARSPDWILVLDGDEVLEKRAASTIRLEIASADPAAPAFSHLYFHILYFWDSMDQYRVDPGIYGDFWQPRLFTLWGQDRERLTFLDSAHGSNLHASGIPDTLKGRGRRIDVKVKHYGYLREEQRRRKYDFYRVKDPEAAARGYYDHLVGAAGTLALAPWTERPEPAPEGGGGDSYFHKPIAYYFSPRPEVRSLIPEGAGRILDVGCGGGAMGRALKGERGGVEVVGVEIDPLMAAAAGKLLDRVLLMNVEPPSLPYPDGYFDCVVLGDILEHLRDPWGTLRGLVRYLAPEGKVVASVPNVRNLAVLTDLVRGEWRYRMDGILDATHLRFFTRRELVRLLLEAGLEAEEWLEVPDHRFSLTVQAERPTYNLDHGDLTLRNLRPEALSELGTIQFLFRASRRRTALSGGSATASIVVITCNGLEFTRMCVQSVLRNTLEPFELIMVDNGSRDETVSFLHGIPGARIIENDTNLGFAAACNQGLAAAAGDYVVFLNNDTIVPHDWLGHLLRHAEASPEVGVVGPRSNYVRPPQVLETPAIAGINDLETFALEVYLSGRGRSLDVSNLSGLCLA
ncbi:MAG: glycosyltransferase, partial [Firmicutes bacterium]|nr:glycosyltransferase [Bacillota bacterium]